MGVHGVKRLGVAVVLPSVGLVAAAPADACARGRGPGPGLPAAQHGGGDGAAVRLSGEEACVALLLPSRLHRRLNPGSAGFPTGSPQVLGVSTDVIGAQQAFAEKLGLTYPLLSDFSRDTVKKYGVMEEDPNSAYFRLAKRAYVVIDQRGIVRHIEVMDHAGHLLDAGDNM